MDGAAKTRLASKYLAGRFALREPPGANELSILVSAAPQRRCQLYIWRRCAAYGLRPRIPRRPVDIVAVR
jgi:hypothetical protein